MAKEGIDSFLLDCHTNENLSEIEAEFGVKGFAVVVRLWQKIYSEKGYYCEWTERSPVLFLTTWFGGNSGVSINFIQEVVNAALRVGIFDEKMHEDYSILTSRGIQKRYFEVVKRRAVVKVAEQYLLVSVGILKGNVDRISISASKNVKNVCRNEDSASQSKVKESKLKESKVKYNAHAREDTPTQDPSQSDMIRKSHLDQERQDINTLIEARKFPPKLEYAVKDWIKYKDEMGSPYHSASANAMLVTVGMKVGEIGEDAVCDAIRESMANQWRSVVYDRAEERARKTMDQESSPFKGNRIGGYDWDAIWRSLNDD